MGVDQTAAFMHFQHGNRPVVRRQGGIDEGGDVEDANDQSVEPVFGVEREVGQKARSALQEVDRGTGVHAPVVDGFHHGLGPVLLEQDVQPQDAFIAGFRFDPGQAVFRIGPLDGLKFGLVRDIGSGIAAPGCFFGAACGNPATGHALQSSQIRVDAVGEIEGRIGRHLLQSNAHGMAFLGPDLQGQGREGGQAGQASQQGED